jgi:hypothetical protein
MANGEAVDELDRYVEFRVRHLGLEPATLERINTHVLVGRPAPAIARLARDLGANLVVLGTPGYRALHGFGLDSLADVIRRETGVAVMTVLPAGAAERHADPEIEPACPACVELRRRTGGARQWCARHSERHGPRHTCRVGAAGNGYSSGSILHP